MFWDAESFSWLNAAVEASSPAGGPDYCLEFDGPYYDLGVYGARWETSQSFLWQSRTSRAPASYLDFHLRHLDAGISLSDSNCYCAAARLSIAWCVWVDEACWLAHHYHLQMPYCAMDLSRHLISFLSQAYRRSHTDHLAAASTRSASGAPSASTRFRCSARARASSVHSPEQSQPTGASTAATLDLSWSSFGCFDRMC